MSDQGIKALAKEWKTDCKNGLTEEEALKRRREFGKNQLKAAKKRSLPEAFFAQLQDPLIYVLAVAAGISILLGEKGDALIIGVVVGLNACVGVLQEGKARKALDSLKELASPRALVCRDGEKRMVEAWELVPGDVVFLEAGCQVPADLKLTETVNLKIEEAVLTGEAYPVEKKGTKDRAYMSTLVTAGRGEGIVTGVGMDTEIGRIAALLDTQKEELTPLQKRLGELGKVLSMLSLLLCGGLFGAGSAAEKKYPGYADHSHFPGGSRSAGRTARRGDDLSCPECDQDGEGTCHRKKAAKRGDSWRCQGSVHRQDREPAPRTG